MSTTITTAPTATIISLFLLGPSNIALSLCSGFLWLLTIPPRLPRLNWSTTCAANTLTAREVWSCKRDEGRPLGAGDQEQAPNRCELLASRALVVSVAEKAGLDPVR
jgi:hypothetical protein